MENTQTIMEAEAEAKGAKCECCSKRLKLLEMSVGKCKCGKTFCKKHRDSFAHECSFDYKKGFILPLVQAQKVIRI